MKRKTEQYDVVVCGGGLAGLCAAIAAARGGAKTALIQNRPVLGGNSSSEIGVTPHGAAAFHAYGRETGIVSEMLVEERSRNHAEIYENGWTNSVWDMVQYDTAVTTPNLTLHLNTDVTGVLLAGHDEPIEDTGAAGDVGLQLGYYHRPALHDQPVTVEAILARQQNAELLLTLRAKTFIDCTGDGLVADRAGCEWRMGTEGKDEFDEPHAPAKASTDTMGNSIHLRARNIGRPSSYATPDWAVKHEDPSFFYEQGRIPKDERGGFWWLEIGVPYHTIHQNEEIRHELTRHALGVWDWMKNHDPAMKQRTKNYALDWIGQVPGKRESRRIIGRTFVTEHDIQDRTVFEDEVAFGGWFVDLHTPGGLLAESSEPSSTGEQEYDTFNDYAVKSYCGPYGIPLGCCIAKDATNLMMAGRNISSTHAALGTIRVMATTALLGEACGAAAAYGVKHSKPLEELTRGSEVKAIQQSLLRGGCFLPNFKNDDAADLARDAETSCSSSALLFGAGPDDRGAHEGLAIWRDQPQYVQENLGLRKGQMFFVGTEGLETVSLCLSNQSSKDETVQVSLMPSDHIWDYRVKTGEPLAQAEVVVPAGASKLWVDCPLPVPTDASRTLGQAVRVDVEGNEPVQWHVADPVVPGCMGQYQIGPNKMRRFGNGATLSFRLSPGQSVYSPSQTLTGVTRPHVHSNLWRSDPAQPMPQWLELAWTKPQVIAEVQLTFPGHLLREYHAYAPFYRDAQCPADYRLQVPEAGGWKTVLEVRDNYQQRRAHRLSEPVSTDRLRVQVDATNGDPAAAIYEVRCYA